MSQEYNPLEYFQDPSGDWRWHIRAKNGRVISMTSEGYTNREDAERAAAITLEAMQKAALHAFKVATDSAQQIMAALVNSLQPTIATLKEYGVFDDDGNLTERGKAVANADTKEEMEAIWARVDAEQQTKEDQSDGGTHTDGAGAARESEDNLA